VRAVQARAKDLKKQNKKKGGKKKSRKG
jgi:hypothetical protein